MLLSIVPVGVGAWAMGALGLPLNASLSYLGCISHS